MNFRSESVFRVGGALVLSVVFISGAFFLGQRDPQKNNVLNATVVVARGDVRTTQPVPDSDGDGIPDWEEALQGTDPTVRTTEKDIAVGEEDSYVTPTTVTDRFSEDFLEDLIRNGAGKNMTPEEQRALIEKSITKLEQGTNTRFYTQADVVSTPENDLTAYREYGNKVGAIITKHSIKNESELTILSRAIAAGDASILKELAPIERAYQRMLTDLLTLPVPSTLAKEHTDFLNTLSMVGADINAMQEAFTDPLGSLVYVQRYQDDATGLFYAIDNIRTALEIRGVAYTNTEPGIFFFSLRP